MAVVTICDFILDMTVIDSKPPSQVTGQGVPAVGIALPPEVAEFLRTSTGKLANDRYRGVGIPFCRFNRKVLYRWEDVHAYVKANLCQRTDDRPSAAPRSQRD